MPYSIRAKVAVEIGVNDGSTTVPILKAMEENDGILHSIDPSEGGTTRVREIVKELGPDTEKHWDFNLTTSDEFFSNFEGEIDFGFIDGNHSCFYVARDVRNCLEHLSYNGLLFVSDYAGPNTRRECVFPEEYVSISDYSSRASNGIYKGLNMVLQDFPSMSHMVLHDRSNASVIISRSFNCRSNVFEAVKDSYRDNPTLGKFDAQREVQAREDEVTYKMDQYNRVKRTDEMVRDLHRRIVEMEARLPKK